MNCARLQRRVVALFETLVERRIDSHQTAQVNVVSKLMNQDALGGIGIARITEQILLTARTIRIGLTATRAASAGIPVILVPNLSGHGHFDMAAYADRFASKL